MTPEERERKEQEVFDFRSLLSDRLILKMV